MTTEQPFLDNDAPENLLPVPAPPEPGPETSAIPNTVRQSRKGAGRKARQESAYPFPAYGFSIALDLARRVEESGGGNLTEETLAVSLGLVKNSSAFRLRRLAAQRFNLINKRNAILTTTDIAKSILKPIRSEDAVYGYQQSFLSIPLFRAVAERYKGQRLPDSQTLRIVLEREFQVEPKRVREAEKVLLESADDTYLLQRQDDGDYLAISEILTYPLDAPTSSAHFQAPATREILDSAAITGGGFPAPLSSFDLSPGNVITFSLDEIGQLSAEDFETVWRAIGILVRSRNSRRHADPETPGGALDYL